MHDKLPALGFGLGLRTEHYNAILESKPNVDWFEALSENYMIPGGKPLHYLDRIRENYPVVLHGVSLSIGSTTPFDADYLRDLKKLADRIQPAWISDHLCWTGVHGQNIHDLLPLPYTEETAKHVAERVGIVQDYLGRRILLENVSSYASYVDSTMTEWEFITEIAEKPRRSAAHSAAARISSSAPRGGCAITSNAARLTSRNSPISCLMKPTRCSTWASATIWNRFLNKLH